MLYDDTSSFWVGESWRSAELTHSRRFLPGSHTMLGQTEMGNDQPSRRLMIGLGPLSLDLRHSDSLQSGTCRWVSQHRLDFISGNSMGESTGREGCPGEVLDRKEHGNVSRREGHPCSKVAKNFSELCCIPTFDCGLSSHCQEVSIPALPPPHF